MLKTSKLVTNTSIFVFAGLIALVTTSCGTSKVAQCTSLVEIVKDVEKTAINLLDSPSDNNSDDKAQGFSNMGIKLQSFQTTLQALDIQEALLHESNLVIEHT
jgi:intracellular sulfur oxidation DsrE/DsrF family protein